MGSAKGGSSVQVPPVSLIWIQGNLLEGGSLSGFPQPGRQCPVLTHKHALFRSIYLRGIGVGTSTLPFKSLTTCSLPTLPFCQHHRKARCRPPVSLLGRVKILEKLERGMWGMGI